MTNSRSGRIPRSHRLTSSNGPNSGRHSSLSRASAPASYTCSIDGACDAPMPPMMRAISAPSALAHLPADLDQRRPRYADQLDHRVDGHPAAPQTDPVSPADEIALVVGQRELLHPPTLVRREQVSL